MRLLNAIAATSNLHLPSVVGLRGLGADIDFTSIIQRGIDVAGSLLARQPSAYISPDDPRYRAQPPQNIYYPAAPNPQATPPVDKNKSGVGVSIDKNTLMLLVGGILIFMVASKR